MLLKKEKLNIQGTRTAEILNTNLINRYANNITYKSNRNSQVTWIKRKNLKWMVCQRKRKNSIEPKWRTINRSWATNVRVILIE